MLVRRRIQTPSVANGPERGSTEGEVVLGASPPARPSSGGGTSTQILARRRPQALGAVRKLLQDRHPMVRGGLRDRRPALDRELAERQRRMLHPQRRDLPQLAR